MPWFLRNQERRAPCTLGKSAQPTSRRVISKRQRSVFGRPIPPVTNRSFHRPRWTGVTKTLRQANSLKVMPRSWERRRASRPSSSTRSAGHLRCDRAAGVAASLDGSSSAPGAAHGHARWRRWPRPGRRGAAQAQSPPHCIGVATTSSLAQERPRSPRSDLEAPAAQSKLGWRDRGRGRRPRAVEVHRETQMQLARVLLGNAFACYTPLRCNGTSRD